MYIRKYLYTYVRAYMCASVCLPACPYIPLPIRVSVRAWFHSSMQAHTCTL